MEEEQPDLEDGEERYCYVRCTRSPRSRDDFQFISEEMISVQRMRRLSRKEPVYLAVIRTTNETENEDTEIDPNIADSMKHSIVTVNDDRTQTQYPKEVHVILDDCANVFPRELPTRLPPQRDLDHHIELVPGAEPPTGHPTECRQRDWMN